MRPFGGFDDFDRETDRWFRRIGVGAVIYGILIVAFWVAVIVVAVHFLAKVW